ncbi:metallophosphoesterase family protein [Candidatus Poriferisodalis sp.]|uniref:metallophosphoesterase family protein n=1 Tax=Candidatus Poriferisodalis sp. TaxID=3101277 RepID=UPI003B02D19F
MPAVTDVSDLAAAVPRDSSLVLLCGDVHGNAEVAARASATAVSGGCGVVLQVGDLGWRPGDERSAEMCAAVSDGGVPWVFVDGNHEHLGDLAARAAPHRGGGSPDPDPDGLWGPAAPLQIAPLLWWAARGARWRWADVAFGALGGAWSPGWHYRRRGLHWFVRETISRRDLAALGDEPLDVLVSHDVPSGVLTVEGSNFARTGDSHIGAANAVQVRTAALRTGARIVVHGHWHHRHTSELAASGDERPPPTRVEGLAANAEPGSLAVLDPATLSVETVRMPAALQA